jgi:hypothetical protein
MGLWILMVGVLGGAVLGRALSHGFSEPFVPVSSLDPSRWRLISPGLSEATQTPGRGSHLSSRALVLTKHLFYRDERVLPVLSGTAAALSVELHADSAALAVVLGSPPHGVVILHYSGAEIQPGLIVPGDGTGRFRVWIESGETWVDGGGGPALVGPSTPDRLELSASGGAARIAALSVRDEAGQVLLNERFDEGDQNTAERGRWTVLGAAIGLVLSGVILVSSPVVAVLAISALLTPLLGVLLVPDWLPLVERLMLKRVPPDTLARTAACLSLIPVVWAGGVLLLQRVWWWSRRVGRLGASKSRRTITLLWGFSVVWAVVTQASFQSHWVVALLALWMGSGLWVQQKAPLETSRWLGLDTLGMLMFCAPGLAPSLLLSAMLRAGMVVAGARSFMGSAATAAVGTLALSLMAMVPGVELSLRATDLNHTWDPTRLTEERPSQAGWQDPQPSWTARCGPADAALVQVLAFGGGSSTGGAYQFKSDPEVFFPAQAHLHLCADLPADTALKTLNFGRGNRDTFTLSRTIDAILKQAPAQLVVLYVGVNDVAGTHESLSRKQRERMTAERNQALQGVTGWGRRLRSVTALWLLTRRLPGAEGAAVPDVPVPDAVENFGIVADAVSAQGGRVLLMTEHMDAEYAHMLREYRAAQNRVAQQRDDVDFFDVRPVFEGWPASEVLVDQNHLTRFANARLGAALAEEIAAAWGWRSRTEDPGAGADEPEPGGG